ncbi:hypothetical protein [Enterococcus gilvus]|uniref:hypothetical protein n=1 Tax=Enterococcus gilvus TaxID=160453 RepID=UPI001C8BE832|nr:hypothetical protein [Enterococcus gilvus]MBX8937665.1 hypothetical protein [Enterococcus gilvus]
MGSLLLVIGLILSVLLIYSVIKYSSRKTEAESIEYDLIVSLKATPVPNIIQHPRIKKTAVWERYGEGVFKGKSSLTKEEMKRLLIKELCLPEENVIVVETTNHLAKSKKEED